MWERAPITHFLVAWSYLTLPHTLEVGTRGKNPTHRELKRCPSHTAVTSQRWESNPGLPWHMATALPSALHSIWDGHDAGSSVYIANSRSHVIKDEDWRRFRMLGLNATDSVAETPADLRHRHDQTVPVLHTDPQMVDQQIIKICRPGKAGSPRCSPEQYFILQDTPGLWIDSAAWLGTVLRVGSLHKPGVHLSFMTS